MHSILYKKNLSLLVLCISCLIRVKPVHAQPDLLLNGGFEDINTCTEYNSECGVEAWFYLKDVKAQMLSNDNPGCTMGKNSFGIFFNWIGYTGFSPVIGTILPCRLQKNKRYTFKGLLMAKLNPRLILKPGIVMGQRFYVPKRPFTSNMKPDSIVQITAVPNSAFYQFEYSFIASGAEKYLTFGAFITEDTLSGKKNFTGAQTISLAMDNFQLLAGDLNEVVCIDFEKNKQSLYNYNFRHKEMDYSLYGKGELAIRFDESDSNYTTHEEKPPPVTLIKADTLKLGDVFFDFNKAQLKSPALKMLGSFFKQDLQHNGIDSVYIEGHTDSIGSETRNLQLSQQRCESVRIWLELNKVLSKDRVQIHPFGKTKPIASNSTVQGRALNRRVEIIVFRKEIEIK